MDRYDPRRCFDLGQRVRHRDDPTLLGYVTAVLLVHPYEVLVRWRQSEQARFVPITALVDDALVETAVCGFSITPSDHRSDVSTELRP